MNDQVDDDGQHDADDEKSDNGEIEGEVVLFYEDVPRQLAQEWDVLAEDQQQPDYDNHAAEDQEYLANSC